MEIWIENKIGYLEGYSTMEQPNQVNLNVEKEPTDFSNWRFDGKVLIHDPHNAPKPEPIPPSEIELLTKQNAKIAMEIAGARIEREKTNKLLAKTAIGLAELKTEVGEK